MKNISNKRKFNVEIDRYFCIMIWKLLLKNMFNKEMYIRCRCIWYLQG